MKYTLIHLTLYLGLLVLFVRAYALSDFTAMVVVACTIVVVVYLQSFGIDK